MGYTIGVNKIVVGLVKIITAGGGGGSGGSSGGGGGSGSSTPDPTPDPTPGSEGSGGSV